MQKANYISYPSEKALEKARQTEAANATYTERFYTLMKLIKISSMISKAKIVSTPQLNTPK